MEEVLAGLRAAAESTRLRLLALLATGELSVRELTRILGQSQPRVSRHLKLMCEAGLIDRFPEGAWVFHRIASKGAGGALATALMALLPENDPTLARDRERLGAVRDERAARAEAYFRDNAARWDEIRSLDIDVGAVEAALSVLLAERPIGDLVDLGTGTGRVLDLAAPLIQRGIGIDLSHEMLALARANLEQSGHGHCMVRRGDITQVPLPAASADAVTVHQVLHYASAPERVVAEAARLLKPGGRLIIVDLAPHEIEVLRERHAHRRLGFSDAEVGGWLAQAGLTLDPPVKIPGGTLTVVLWLAHKKETRS